MPKGEPRNAITTLPLRYKDNTLIELGLPVVEQSAINLMKKHSSPTLIINRVSLTRTDAELENIIVTFVFSLSDKYAEKIQKYLVPLFGKFPKYNVILWQNPDQLELRGRNKYYVYQC